MLDISGPESYTVGLAYMLFFVRRIRVIKGLRKNPRAVIVCIVVVSLSAAAVFGESEIPQRKYAPDRKVDIRHIVIDVTPDFEKRTVAGVTTIEFAPIAMPLYELRLDAVDLDISAVTSSAEIDDYSVTDEAVAITFDPPIRPAKRPR